MKDTEIHNNKTNARIRDFLSLSLVRIFDEECNNRKPAILHDYDNPIDWAVHDCKLDIAHYQRKLELLEQKQAVIKLINMNGWKEFDVSDYVEKDSAFKLKMSFLGTEDEYYNLMLELKTT